MVATDHLEYSFRHLVFSESSGNNISTLERAVSVNFRYRSILSVDIVNSFTMCQSGKLYIVSPEMRNLREIGHERI